MLATLSVDLPSNSWFKWAAVEISKTSLPGDPRTFCEAWDDLTRDIDYFERQMLIADNPVKAATLKAKIDVRRRDLRILREQLWVGIKINLCEGNLWAIGWRDGQKMIVPSQAWIRGQYDWDGRVLLDGDARYDEVLAIVGPLTNEQREFVRNGVSGLEARPKSGSGVPGRPTSRAHVEGELHRRAEAGQLAPTLAQEAQYLAGWLRTAHPDAHPMTVKTITNALREAYWALRGAANA